MRGSAGPADHAAAHDTRREAGADELPKCEHGRLVFAGSDYKRKASKWRCNTGECRAASGWVKATRIHPLIPRDSDRHQARVRARQGAPYRARRRSWHGGGQSDRTDADASNVAKGGET